VALFEHAGLGAVGGAAALPNAETKPGDEHGGGAHEALHRGTVAAEHGAFSSPATLKRSRSRPNKFSLLFLREIAELVDSDCALVLLGTEYDAVFAEHAAEPTGVPIQELDPANSAARFSVQRATASHLPSRISPHARLR
jgi:hypothetical protein